jgi:putative tryptophan/tyrosine transport system substrate-binding protein
MAIHIGRRAFITLLGGAAAWPISAGAQQAGKIARIGFLGAVSASGYARQVEEFRSGLRDLGYVEGTNIIIVYRWAEGNYARLPELAAALIRSNVDVIVTHGTPGALAAKQATVTVPIVVMLGDPLASGIVTSLARPGGNITGQSFFNPELTARRIELLKQMLPAMTRLAYLFNPDNPAGAGPSLQAARAAAQSLKVELQQFPIRGPSEFESAFERMESAHVEAFEVDEDAVFNAHARAIVELATNGRLLSIGSKEFAEAGALMGYGIDLVAIFRRASVFVDKILKGTKPSDIPIEQATKFLFVLNLKTAKTLHLAIPPTLLALADEVIE